EGVSRASLDRSAAGTARVIIPFDPAAFVFARQPTSQQVAVEQREQAQHVPAAAAGEKSKALARAVLAPPDADMVQRADAQAVDGEAAAADETLDFVEGVVTRPAASPDVKNADAVAARRADQAD